MFLTAFSGSQKFSEAGLTEPLLLKEPDLDLKISLMIKI